jgi:hypothetical protein
MPKVVLGAVLTMLTVLCADAFKINALTTLAVNTIFFIKFLLRLKI